MSFTQKSIKNYLALNKLKINTLLKTLINISTKNCIQKKNHKPHKTNTPNILIQNAYLLD